MIITIRDPLTEKSTSGWNYIPEPSIAIPVIFFHRPIRKDALLYKETVTSKKQIVVQDKSSVRHVSLDYLGGERALLSTGLSNYIIPWHPWISSVKGTFSVLICIIEFDFYLLFMNLTICNNLKLKVKKKSIYLFSFISFYKAIVTITVSKSKGHDPIRNQNTCRLT